MTTTQLISIVTGMTALLLVSACGQKEAEPAVDAGVSTTTEQSVATLPRTASPAGARVFFITPADGESVSNPVVIEFGIEGMEIAAAGVNEAHSGHHHLLIDTNPPDLSLPIPADANHVHFGDASTSTELTLESGEHTLQLLLGDHLHIPHDPPILSDTITVMVK